MCGPPACFRREGADMSGVTLAAPKPKHAVAVKRDIVLPAVIFVVFALLPAVAGLTASNI